MSTTIAISPCPNDVYIFAGLILKKIDWPLKEDVEFHFYDVEELNRSVLQQTYDVCKISAANWPRIQSHYHLLPCGGAMGYGCGPLLVANNTVWNPEKPTWIPGKYTTAAALLKFYSPQTPQVEMSFEKLYKHIQTNTGEQGVVIHENRFTYERDGLSLICDLGRHWEEKTRCPIPLGLVVVREQSMVQSLTQAIQASLEWSHMHEEEAYNLCAMYAQEMDSKVMRQHVEMFVNDFSCDMGFSGLCAIDELIRVFPALSA